MSKQIVTVTRIAVRPHENADKLEIATVEGYDCVIGIPGPEETRKRLVTGDLAAYIPVDSVLPADLITLMGLEGKLAGKDANRVKAVRLRGVFSMGLVLEAREGWTEGQDVADELGIEKYEPPIPATMAGKVMRIKDPLDVPGRSVSSMFNYDIENARGFKSDKKNPFTMGEQIVVTEKIHGTNVQFGLTGAHPVTGERTFYVASKGLAKQGVALDPNNAENVNNLYVRTAVYHGIEQRLRDCLGENPAPIRLIGEIFGAGVQDLTYGYDSSRPETTGVRFFDIYIGGIDSRDPESGRTVTHGRYLSDTYVDPVTGAEVRELDDVLAALQLPRVPVLYRGPYSPELVDQYTSGQETVSGKSLHIREGVVFRPVTDRRNDSLGRVCLKSVSPAYLLRKGGTEFN